MSKALLGSPRRLVALTAGVALTASAAVAITSASAPAGAVLPQQPGTYVPISAVNVLDTGNAIGVSTRTPVPAHGTVTVQIAGRPGSGIPATGVSAVAMTLAVTSTGSGFATVYPSDIARPGAASIDFAAGRTATNLAYAKLGASGAISLYNGTSGTSRLYVNVSGYFVGGVATDAATYVPLPPANVLDTGTGVGTGGHVALVPAHGTVSVTVAGSGGVPLTGAASAALNVAVISTASGGFLTAYAADQARPAAASVDFAANSSTATLTTIGLSSNGAVTFYNGSSAGVRVVANVFGYYRTGVAAVPGSFVQVTPTNLYDSAVDGGNIPAHAAVDPAAVSSPTRAAAWVGGRTALVVAVAVVNPPASGFLTAYAAGQPRPGAANLDFAPGQMTLNGANVPVDAQGGIDLYNGSAGAIRAVVNLFGYYLSGSGPVGSCAGFSNTTGISNSTITLANASDISGPVPGFYQAAQQATEAYAAYFNSVSSICGRSLSVDALDTETSAAGDQQATTTACGSAFAMVGSMASFDGGGAAVAAQCGIPDIRTQPSSLARQNAADTYGVGYGDVNQIPTVVPQYFVQNAPAAAANAAYLYLDAGSFTTEAQTDIAGWTQEGFHFLYTAGIAVTTLNYTTYVSSMVAKGVKYVQFRGPYQYAIRLAQAMQQQAFAPLFVMSPEAYDAGYAASGGSAVNGTLVFDNAALFEESASNPEMQLYEHWLQVVAPGATPTYVGLYAWSAGRLFTDEALALGGKLSRASLLAALANVHAWTGHGLFSAEDVGNKVTSGCAAIIQLVNGTWTRQSQGSYLCGPVLPVATS